MVLPLAESIPSCDGNSKCFFPNTDWPLDVYLEIEITLRTLIAPVFRRPGTFVHVDWARNIINIIIMALFVPIHQDRNDVGNQVIIQNAVVRIAKWVALWLVGAKPIDCAQ